MTVKGQRRRYPSVLLLDKVLLLTYMKCDITHVRERGTLSQKGSIESITTPHRVATPLTGPPKSRLQNTLFRQSPWTDDHEELAALPGVTAKTSMREDYSE